MVRDEEIEVQSFFVEDEEILDCKVERFRRRLNKDDLIESERVEEIERECQKGILVEQIRFL